MSYIINNNDPFVSIKLTQSGREQLAKGALNFQYWAIGDSEINYGREEIVNNNPTDVTLSGISKIMRPFDKQPNIKSYITKISGEPLNTLNNTNIRTVKAIINNEANERGFFSGNTTHSSFSTMTSDTYIRDTGTIPNSKMSGGTTLDIGTGATREIGDYLLIRVSNDTVGSVTGLTNDIAVPNLWYKIQATTGSSITVDRDLPNLVNEVSSNSLFVVYRGGEVYESIATGNTTSYWNTGTLTFNSSCDVSCDDVPVWNMNNIWCEDLAGITGTTYEGHEYFGSYQYLGAKNPFFEYLCVGTANTADVACEGAGLGVLDDVHKSISLIHYTNNSVANVYGEYFYIDNDNDKTVKLHYPTLMYHRRTGATGSGTTQGMTFVASGSVKTVGTSDLEYVDLIEDPTMIDATTPRVVGRVYPQLKAISIDDEEIVAATSYKSNRNWTLPHLACALEAPSGGTSTGILAPNETAYVTYTIENSTGTGLTSTLPCQKYIKITNTTANNKDITFRMNTADDLPYMRKIEDGGYDGLGFYGYNFKVLFQKVADSDDRPDPTAWNVYDYTTSGLTTNSGETINPVQLENQSPVTNGFIITELTNTASTTFDLTQLLDMAPKTSPTDLQFGDERFFYGNIETYIGATIYKTFFPITINSGEFDTTGNNTRSKDLTTNPPDIMVSEVGIYDGNKNLVIVGKLSRPTKLLAGNTIMVELSMDF
jgi:hypothetical protein